MEHISYWVCFGFFFLMCQYFNVLLKNGKHKYPKAFQQQKNYLDDVHWLSIILQPFHILSTFSLLSYNAVAVLNALIPQRQMKAVLRVGDHTF